MGKLFMNGKPVGGGNHHHHNQQRRNRSTGPTNNNNNNNKPSNTAAIAIETTTAATTNNQIINPALTVISDSDLATTINALQAIHDAGEDVIHHSRFKQLRSVIFPLVSSSHNSNNNHSEGVVGGRVARVSDFLTKKDFASALAVLERMRQLGEIPKLGSVQRWVRDIDAVSAHHDNLAPFVILDMVMRVSAPEQISIHPTPKHIIDAAKANNNNPLIDWKTFFFGRGRYASEKSGVLFQGGSAVRAVYNGPEDPNNSLSSSNNNDLLDPPMIPDLTGKHNNDRWKGFLQPVRFEKGADRRPQNKHDLTIWTNDFDLDKKLYLERMEREKENGDSENKEQDAEDKNNNNNNNNNNIFIPTPSLVLDPSPTARNRVEREDISDIPGGLTFAMKNVLSVEESHSIIQLLESAGFAPDCPLTNSTSVLADNVVWIPDNERFMKTLVDRVTPHLPMTLLDGQVKYTGINRRFRCYRYQQEKHAYRTHIDGGWNRSSIDYETKEVIDDASHGTEFSQLTFLLYLNSGFKEGTTKYFLPCFETGMMKSLSVVPSTGCVMIFPHQLSGTLAHEGSGVEEGTKYIIRTEVMYTKIGVEKK